MKYGEWRFWGAERGFSRAERRAAQPINSSIRRLWKNVGPPNAEIRGLARSTSGLKFLNVFPHFLDAVFQLIAGLNQIALIENHTRSHENDELGAVVTVALVAE